MDKEDARKQSLGALPGRRKRVIRLYKKGHKVMQIVDLTGLSWPTRSGGDRSLRGWWSNGVETERAR